MSQGTNHPGLREATARWGEHRTPESPQPQPLYASRRLQIANTSVPTPKNQPFHLILSTSDNQITMVGFCDFPTELQHLIVLNLHPSAAVALRQTNRWFHTHISLHRLDRTAVQDYLHHLELLPKHQHDYACFSCLSLKPHTAFTTTQLTPMDNICSSYNSKRFCLDCGVKGAKFKAFSRLNIGEDELWSKVFCGACSSVQPLFCPRCHCCGGCLARMKTWTGRAALWQQSGGEKLCPTHSRS